MKGQLTLAALSTLTFAQKQDANIGHRDTCHGEDWYDCGPYGGEFLFHGYTTEYCC
jgi:hypothetical protein